MGGRWAEPKKCRESRLRAPTLSTLVDNVGENVGETPTDLGESCVHSIVDKLRTMLDRCADLRFCREIESWSVDKKKVGARP